MKKKTKISLVIALMTAIIVIEEIRIGELRASQEELQQDVVLLTINSEKRIHRKPEGVLESDRKRVRSSSRDGSKNADPESINGDFGKAMRKMADNPAAKAILAHASRGTVLGLYGSLIDGFNLSREEGDYFVNLLAGEMASQQELAMKLMGTKDPAELKGLYEKLEGVTEEHKKLVKEFLNNDEDMDTFDAFRDRLAEHQQIPGIRAAMEEAGLTITSEQEESVIEALHAARLEPTNGEKLSEAEEFAKLREDNALDNFEQDWQRSQTFLKEELRNVLEAEQMIAFLKAQEQMKELNLMGIKMLRGMLITDEGN